MCTVVLVVICTALFVYYFILLYNLSVAVSALSYKIFYFTLLYVNRLGKFALG